MPAVGCFAQPTARALKTAGWTIYPRARPVSGVSTARGRSLILLHTARSALKESQVKFAQTNWISKHINLYNPVPSDGKGHDRKRLSSRKP
jgi:hypothetical protein